MKPLWPRTMTPDCKRHGTTDLFGAMNVSAGEVPHNTRHSHKATDVLALVELMDLGVPPHLAIHVLLDNLARCKTEHTATWVPHRRQARWHQHSTPRLASSLNLLVGPLSLLPERQLRRGSFSSAHDLLLAITTWPKYSNPDPKSSVSKKPPDEIVSKMRAGPSTLALIKSATHDQPRSAKRERSHDHTF